MGGGEGGEEWRQGSEILNPKPLSPKPQTPNSKPVVRYSEEAWEAARAARRGAKEAAEKASVEKENLRVLLTKADQR